MEDKSENKRDRRRLVREKEYGPERNIVSFSAEANVLSCGHIILNPPIQKTTNMRPPKFRRCLECKVK